DGAGSTVHLQDDGHVGGAAVRGLVGPGGGWEVVRFRLGRDVNVARGIEGQIARAVMLAAAVPGGPQELAGRTQLGQVNVLIAVGGPEGGRQVRRERAPEHVGVARRVHGGADAEVGVTAAEEGGEPARHISALEEVHPQSGPAGPLRAQGGITAEPGAEGRHRGSFRAGEYVSGKIASRPAYSNAGSS